MLYRWRFAAVLDHYPFAVFIHILGALGLFVTLALEWLVAIADQQSNAWVATRSVARRIGALSMALLVVPGMLMTFTRWTFLSWPAAGLIGMAAMVAVGVLLSRRPALQLQSVQIRLAVVLGVVAVMVFKPDLLSSLMILTAATLIGIGISLVASGGQRSAGSKLRVGSTSPQRELATISEERISIPDRARLVHLQFRRFAGCPVCNLHLQSFVRRYSELANTGIREVVVFHSSRVALLEHAANLPFAVVADPTKELYAEFGVESSVWALLDPRAWFPIIRGVARSAAYIAARQGRPPSLTPAGGRFGLPADFLIATDGRILAVKYGSHAYDQWSVDELLALAQPAIKTATAPTASFQPGGANAWCRMQTS
jgi:peroxiredoxin